MPHTLKFEKRAKKDLEELNHIKRKRIINKLEWFSQHPNRSKNVKYIDKYDCLRYRVGNFRIFFEKNKEDEEIIILKIDKRPKAYRD
ncbi:MAG: type II toxin-antitoxin system RelE family toxin [archaeon]